MSTTVLSSIHAEKELLQLCERTNRLTESIRNRLKKGDSAKDLLDLLERMWENPPQCEFLSEATRRVLEMTLNGIDLASSAGQHWLTSAFEELDRLTKAELFRRAYQSNE